MGSRERGEEKSQHQLSGELIFLHWRYLSLHIPHATAFLTAPPCSTPFMMKAMWRAMLRFYFGASVYDVPSNQKLAACSI